MVFSSLTFIVFFLPLVLGFYFLCPNPRHKNAVLLLFSLVFYAWGEPKWLFVMLLVVAVNYLSGILMLASQSKTGRFVSMMFGVATGLGFLFYFKYCGFFVDNVTALFGEKSSFDAPVLPIGISFYTFQVLTYTIDVYKFKVRPQKNFFRLLMYVSFFPQLIAGPIVNYKDIEKQLRKRTVTLDGFYNGFVRFCYGLSKKILLANSCGRVLENLEKANVTSVGGAWLITVFFGLQLYFDFSGYSSMAIGLGKMFGFDFAENFNYPYAADSVTDFWRRWHISLGAFFREYVYIPLGGNRKGKARTIVNLLIVWAFTGIWHGSAWNFLFWGLYYGILLILEKFVFAGVKKHIPKFVNIAITLFFVFIGWSIFYFTDTARLGTHLLRMFGRGTTGLFDRTSLYYVKRNIGLIVISVIACIPFKKLTDRISADKKLKPVFEATKAVFATVLLIVSIAWLVSQSYNPFLYFRF